mmetsp:Transcript_6046/g.16478  ORF Transcript_6046/g.16478 Transcript_6046/m.16478 type:complete len:338 (-) Transcript_6046:150-1163(-)|eukprot:CAMPEP_0198136264 /NCGR_PEP_ID=MMETSP1442-20131203/61021_1 /TAXON_ID= /ORGANISM="Craspedostauros australis, Strain CCMP3328" /LENGTH=337 /DNA_ID=CAMNT_0043797473 /DNA_START=1138 /DNA_END=2151 /DNA_ORIENTATION=-
MTHHHANTQSCTAAPSPPANIHEHSFGDGLAGVKQNEPDGNHGNLHIRNDNNNEGHHGGRYKQQHNLRIDKNACADDSANVGANLLLSLFHHTPPASSREVTSHKQVATSMFSLALGVPSMDCSSSTSTSSTMPTDESPMRRPSQPTRFDHHHHSNDDDSQPRAMEQQQQQPEQDRPQQKRRRPRQQQQQQQQRQQAHNHAHVANHAARRPQSIAATVSDDEDDHPHGHKRQCRHYGTSSINASSVLVSPRLPTRPAKSSSACSIGIMHRIYRPQSEKGSQQHGDDEQTTYSYDAIVTNSATARSVLSIAAQGRPLAPPPRLPHLQGFDVATDSHST